MELEPLVMTSQFDSGVFNLDHVKQEKKLKRDSALNFIMDTHQLSELVFHFSATSFPYGCSV